MNLFFLSTLSPKLLSKCGKTSLDLSRVSFLRRFASNPGVHSAVAGSASSSFAYFRGRLNKHVENTTAQTNGSCKCFGSAVQSVASAESFYRLAICLKSRRITHAPGSCAHIQRILAGVLEHSSISRRHRRPGTLSSSSHRRRPPKPSSSSPPPSFKETSGNGAIRVCVFFLRSTFGRVFVQVRMAYSYTHIFARRRRRQCLFDTRRNTYNLRRLRGFRVSRLEERHCSRSPSSVLGTSGQTRTVGG